MFDSENVKNLECGKDPLMGENTMFIWAILACSALLIQASGEQTLYEQNIQHCLRDLFAQYNKSQQETPSKTIAKLATEFKKTIDGNDGYKNIKSTDLLIATNKHSNIQYHFEKYQKFLEAICFLYARNLYVRNNITIPNSLPTELHATVAGALLALLLLKTQTVSQAEIIIENDYFEPGTKTSETGITYILRTKQVYATIDKNKIVPNKHWALDKNADYSFGGVSTDDLFMYHIKADTVSKKTVLELYELKNGTIHNTDLPANSTAIDIVYNTQNKTFAIVLFYFQPNKIQLLFYNPTTKQKIVSVQKDLPVELLAGAVQPGNPDMRAEIVYADKATSLFTLRKLFKWDYTDYYIVGTCPIHQSIKLIVYNNNKKSFSFINDPNTFIKDNQDYIISLLNLYIQNVGIPYLSLTPKTFIIDYNPTIQEKLHLYINSTEIHNISFDFTYMRYIEKNRRQKKIIVYDILPHKLCAVSNFMNMRYHELGDKYTNILNDALYAVHALNNTATYQSLQHGDTRISHISKELLAILPLPQSKASAFYASIKRNLGSLWYNTTDWVKRNYLLVGALTTVGGLMLFNYLQEQKLLYPNKPAPDPSKFWPNTMGSRRN